MGVYYVVWIVGILLTVLGAMLGTFTTLMEKRRPGLELKGGKAGGAKKPTVPPRISRSGVVVLSVFAAVVVLYGLFTLIWYWQEFRQRIDDALLSQTRAVIRAQTTSTEEDQRIPKGM